MSKSHFLNVSRKVLESQMKEQISASVSPGFLTVFALLPPSFPFLLNTAQICHCPFFISLFSGFGFLRCCSWWAEHSFPWSSVRFCFHWHTDSVFVLAFRSSLISFLSFNSLLSSLQIWLPSCLAASSLSYLAGQGKAVCAVQQVQGGKAEKSYVQQRELEVSFRVWCYFLCFIFKYWFKWKLVPLLENTHNQRSTYFDHLKYITLFYEYKLKYIIGRLFIA